jgi:hypothetical protein
VSALTDYANLCARVVRMSAVPRTRQAEETTAAAQLLAELKAYAAGGPLQLGDYTQRLARVAAWANRGADEPWMAFAAGGPDRSPPAVAFLRPQPPLVDGPTAAQAWTIFESLLTFAPGGTLYQALKSANAVADGVPEALAAAAAAATSAIVTAIKWIAGGLVPQARSAAAGGRARGPRPGRRRRGRRRERLADPLSLLQVPPCLRSSPMSLLKAREKAVSKAANKASTRPHKECAALAAEKERIEKRLEAKLKSNAEARKKAHGVMVAKHKKEAERLLARHTAELKQLDDRFGCTPKPRKPRKPRERKAKAGAANEAPKPETPASTTGNARAKRGSKKASSKKKPDVPTRAASRAAMTLPDDHARGEFRATWDRSANRVAVYSPYEADKSRRKVKEQLLRRHGFSWSAAATRWQRKASPDAWADATRIVDDLAAAPARPVAPPVVLDMSPEPESEAAPLPGPAGPPMLSWGELVDRFRVAGSREAGGHSPSAAQLVERAEANGWRINLLGGALGHGSNHVELEPALDIGAKGVVQVFLHADEHEARRDVAPGLLYATRSGPRRLPDSSLEGRRAAVVAALSETPPIHGAATTVAVTAARGAVWGVPARYVLRRARDLVASHDAQVFAPRPDYPPGLQERRYEARDEQMKVDALAELPAVLQGAPVVAAGPSAIVLGGNGRTLAAQRHYLAGRTALREYLLKHADDFGLTRRQVEQLEDPLVVREVHVPMSQWYRLVRALNVATAQTSLFKG